MERVAIVFGLILCGLTVFGLLVSPLKPPAVFVPLLFGIPALLCGVVSLNPHRRRVGMGLAAGIGGLGAIVGGLKASFLLFGFLSGDGVNRLAFGIVLAMVVACAAFVITWSLAMWRGLTFTRQRPGRQRRGEGQSGGAADGPNTAD